MGELKNVGLYVLLLIPGFIWVQVYEHHLLREKKEQFVKTLEIIFWSAIVWALALWLPFAKSKMALHAVTLTILGKDSVSALADKPTEVMSFYISVCGWTFVTANVWAIFRKTRIINMLIKALTGRDWYPSAAFRFFKENVDKGISVVVGEKRYIGVLYSAPDTVEDKYIILTSVWILPEPNVERVHPEQLKMVSQLLVNIDEIKEMRASVQGLATESHPWRKLLANVRSFWTESEDYREKKQ